MAQAKILACGDVNGRFDLLLKRIKNVNAANGPFEFVVCVGEFFGPNAEENEKISSGAIEFPIPVYILGPCCPSTLYLILPGPCCPSTSKFYPEKPSDMTSNVTYLGKSGTLSTASGFTIAYLSGVPAGPSGCNSFEFDADTVDNLTGPALASTSFVGVDILLTSVWPAQVARHSTNQPTRQITGSEEISRLATILKPRYHFVGMGVHYERDPYRNHEILQESAQHVTRFVSLAPVGNKEKQKWMYAFGSKPLKTMTREELVMQPPMTSEFPYKDLLSKAYAKKQQEVATQGGAQFFYDMDAPMTAEEEAERQHGRKRHHSGGDAPPEKRAPSAPCWFCLSNKDVEKELIVSVGVHCYLAMPKGPLTDDHLMVLTVGHIQSLVAASAEVREELEQFRDALTLFFDARGKSLVLFERNFKTGHLQVQAVGVPKESMRSLRSAFLTGAQAKGFELTALEKGQEVWDLVNEGCPYFNVRLPDGSQLFTRSMRNFPLQFGREVLASKPLLDCEEKVDWRDCELPKAQQAALVKKLAEGFKKFKTFGDSDDEDSD
uniref:CWF19-like protein 1 n=1 Tax=Steinernema glaseri TaxID=37863 RepID=A0A1I7Y275_9BILA